MIKVVCNIILIFRWYSLQKRSLCVWHSVQYTITRRNLRFLWCPKKREKMSKMTGRCHGMSSKIGQKKTSPTSEKSQLNIEDVCRRHLFLTFLCGDISCAMWMPRRRHISGNFTGSATWEWISSEGLVMWRMTWSRQNLTWRRENLTWTRQNMTWRATSAEFGWDFHCSFGRQRHHLDVPCDIRYVSADIFDDTVVFPEMSILTRAMSI